jgi:hypothetical protein
MRLCMALALLLLGCDVGGLIIVETIDASVDAPERVTPIVDAATCGNGNPGTGACFDPIKDCPPEDACWRFECVMGPGEIKVCGSIAKPDASQ